LIEARRKLAFLKGFLADRGAGLMSFPQFKKGFIIGKPAPLQFVSNIHAIPTKVH
jgi:hypothetical protein